MRENTVLKHVLQTISDSIVLQNKFGLARMDTVGGYRDLNISVIFTEPRYNYKPAC
jgi:hypothetical protein